MEIAVFIQNIQEERAEVALYIFSNQTTGNMNVSELALDHAINRMGLAERFKQTDRALEDIPTWPNVSVKNGEQTQNNDDMPYIIKAVRHYWGGH